MSTGREQISLASSLLSLQVIPNSPVQVARCEVSMEPHFSLISSSSASKGNLVLSLIPIPHVTLQGVHCDHGVSGQLSCT